MSIKFKPVAHKNLQNPTAPPKYYAVAEKQGITDLDDLALQIAQKSTVSRADVYAVIISFVENTIGELKAGRTVKLGKMGSFSISLSSNGMETPEDVTSQSIKKAKMLYRPGAELKEMLKSLKYEKKA